MVILMKIKIRYLIPLMVAFMAMISGTIVLFAGALTNKDNYMITAFILYAASILIYAILVIIAFVLFLKKEKDTDE